MTALMRKAASTIVNGANSIFFGDTTLLIKRSWIDNDSEAIRKDWEAVGMDWKIVTKIYDAIFLVIKLKIKCKKFL